MAERSEAMAGAPDSRQLFERVTGDYEGLIARIAMTYEADLSLRRELIQDILLAIWVALPSFRNESSLKTFVASIAQKRSISHVARRAREPAQIELPEDLQSAALAPDEIALENDRMRQLNATIQRLPLPQREAIVLCFEGFSYGEVAAILGISVNAATLRCQRAKLTLRTILDEEE